MSTGCCMESKLTINSILKKNFNVDLFLTEERQSTRGGGAEREGDMESEAGSRL